jgi:hypothetical protein
VIQSLPEPLKPQLEASLPLQLKYQQTFVPDTLICPHLFIVLAAPDTTLHPPEGLPNGLLQPGSAKK